MSARVHAAPIPATSTTGFHSILFADPDGATDDDTMPAFLADLNLDQVFEATVAGRELYNLMPFLCRPLTDIDAIAYRHEVFKDLEAGPPRQAVEAFARGDGHDARAPGSRGQPPPRVPAGELVPGRRGGVRPRPWPPWPRSSLPLIFGHAVSWGSAITSPPTSGRTRSADPPPKHRS